MAESFNLGKPQGALVASVEKGSAADKAGIEVGDIIPLTMPRHVPVTVAGRSFAVGSIGEANGNAAIMIEHIEKGPDND